MNAFDVDQPRAEGNSRVEQVVAIDAVRNDDWRHGYA